MSRYHLSRLFQREMGFSPHEYLIETRLRAAKNQLSDSAPPGGFVPAG